MKSSNFNIRSKLLKTIVNHLFPKLENICEVFDIDEIAVVDVEKSTLNSMSGNSIKFNFNISPKKATDKSRHNEYVINYSRGYSNSKTYKISEFEEKTELDCDMLIKMSNLFLQKIKTYSEKENQTNKIIDELKKLEIIYKKELLLEKIKRTIQTIKPNVITVGRQPINDEYGCEIDVFVDEDGEIEYEHDENYNLPTETNIDDMIIKSFPGLVQNIHERNGAVGIRDYIVEIIKNKNI